MRDHVVIIAPPEDLHAQTVAWELESLGARAIILDLADFPERWCLSLYEKTGTRGRFVVDTQDYGPIDESHLSGVWRRRASPYRIPDAVDTIQDQRFAGRECRAMIEGWLLGLGERVINPLANEYAAERKPFQLHRAALAGLKVPETLISNSPGRVADFTALQFGRRIHKPLTTMRNSSILFTRMVDEEARSNLDRLVSGPSIFQEAVLGGLDVRVTMVDDMLFAASLHVDRPQERTDWRTDPNVRTSAHLLPPAVESSLRALHADLGLRYGAYDLRSNAQGEYHFLEVNTAGQYLWVETDAGHPIAF